MTADQVKDAVRRRHPGATHGGMVGQWTCIEEWLGIDLLALNAWSKACVVGYEVKVSRSDMRRELLRPHKRAGALAVTTEFYFAVPDGLYTDDELAYQEPDWDTHDFARQRCPGIPQFGPPQRYRRDPEPRYGGQCRGRKQPFTLSLPLPLVLEPRSWHQPRLDESPEAYAARVARDLELSVWDAEQSVPCPRCGGRGYIDVSRVEHHAPTLWVPRDVGLVVVYETGTTRAVKKAPRRKDPEPIAPTRKQLNDLVRWVSHRPDPRHLPSIVDTQAVAA